MASHTHTDEDWVDISESRDAGSHGAPVQKALRSTEEPLQHKSIPSRAHPANRDPPVSKPKNSTPNAANARASYKAMRENADRLLRSGAPIFHVDLGDNKHAIRDTYNAYLGDGYYIKYGHFHVPSNRHPHEAMRQEFNCSACHQFMKAFGDLAVIDPKSGTLMPLFWDKSFQRLLWNAWFVTELFEGKRVRKLFRVTKKTMVAGMTESGGFSHMSYEFPAKRLCKPELKGFASATCAELAEMLDKILTKYQDSTVNTAAELLAKNKLPHAEKHKAAIGWLRTLIKKRPLANLSGEVERHNILYLIAADAFVGCIQQLRSGALSTLLDDIEAGLPFSTFKSKWAATVSPVAYMRPTAAPSAGNVAAAEKLFAELGITERDLGRTYLSKKDIPKETFLYRSFNKPSTAAPKSGGVFGSIVPKPAPSPFAQDDPSIPPTSLTFASFVNTVLKSAKTIEYDLPSHPNLFFSITGKPDTKPLMQWHTPTNLVSHYTYIKPRAATAHNLKAGWVTVTSIILAANLWEGISATRTLPLSDELVNGTESDNTKKYKHGHHGWNYLLCLEGIRDESKQSCLFPESMKKEFHGIRSTIEAYSKSHGIPKPANDEPIVGGVMVGRSIKDLNHLFRVKSNDGKVGRYKVTLFQ